MKRRTFLKGVAATSLMFGYSRTAGAQTSKVLKFVPQSDLAFLDPMISSPAITRTHGYMVFDTLFGLDDSYNPAPQMVEGVVTENNSRLWKLKLREGLLFHDGEPVLARDVVASLKRWGARDLFGKSVIAATDELLAVDDRTIQFRMKQPFPLLPYALGKIPPLMAAIMPERLAVTDPTEQVPELVGSGPFKFLAGERVPGAHIAYERFAGYVPRSDGAGLTAGPKIAKFDRIEWQIMPEPATAAAALESGEVDWLESPHPDLIPQLRANSALRVEPIDRTGIVPILRFNCLQPPFDNPEIRRVVLRAVKQADFMSATTSDTTMWSDKVGVFTPGTPLANQTGIDVFGSIADAESAKAELEKAGYKGERVVVLAASDIPVVAAVSQVGADLLKRMGFNVDLQVTDWGTVAQRRANQDSVDKGGWSCFFVHFEGATLMSPATALITRGTGKDAWFGWPTSEALEKLNSEYLVAPTLEAQQALAVKLQEQFWQDVPAIPLGHILLPMAFRANLVNLPGGFPKFYGVDRS